MKTFVAVFLLASSLPHHAMANNKILEGEVEVGVFVDCLFDADEAPVGEGEIVEGTCDYAIKKDSRFLRNTNLRRNLKSGKDDEFFVTWKKCKLEGSDSNDEYVLSDGVKSFQDTEFTQDIDINGDGVVEENVETIVRSLTDVLSIHNKFGTLVATGDKKTVITITDDINGDPIVLSIDSMDVDWKAVSCDQLKDVDLALVEQGFIFVSSSP